MGTNLSDKGRETAAIKAEKRAAALRENLKRRKQAQTSATKDQKGNKNADTETIE